MSKRASPSAVTRPLELRSFLMRGGLLAALGRGAGMVTSLVVYALVARLLPPGDAGLFFLFFSVITVSTAVGQLGLPRTAVFQLGIALAREDLGRARSVAHSVLVLSLLGGTAVALLLASWPGLMVMRLQGIEPEPLLMILLAAWSFGKVMEGITAEVFRGFKRIGHAVVLTSVLSGGFLIVALLILLVLRHLAGWRPAIEHVVASSAAAALLAALLGAGKLWWQVRGLPHGRRDPPWGRLLGWSWPIMATTIVVMLWEAAGMFILSSVVRDEAELALFGTAVRASRLVITPLIIANSVLMPVLAELYARKEQDKMTAVLRLSATATSLPALVLVVVVMFTNKPLMGTVFGSFYRDSGPILVILCLSQLLNVLTGSCGVTLLMSGRQNLHLVINLLGLAALVISGALLSEAYGSLGMALATLISRLFHQALLLIGVRWQVGVWSLASLDPRSLRQYWRMLPGIGA